jgi:hypothetical protein
MYLIRNISFHIKKFVWVDFVLLFFISLIIVLKTGISGVISPVDTMFSYYPLHDFIRYSYIWFNYQGGYVLSQSYMGQLPILGMSAFLNVVGFPLWVINRLWFIVPIFLLGCSAYYFTDSIVDKNKNKRLISLLAALLFILNYYTVMTISIGGVRELISVAFSIFSLAFFIKGIRTKDTKYIALITISSVFAVGVIAYAIIAIFLAALFVIVHLFITRGFKQDIKFTFYSFSAFLLSSLWWILPFLFTSTGQNYNGNPSASVQAVASFNSLLRTLILKNSIPALPVNEIQFSALANVAGLLIVILASASLLFKQYRKIAIWASFAILALIPFALGGTPPFGSIYIFAYNHIPLFYIFRNPTRFTAYLALFYALLTSITLVGIIHLVKQKLHKQFLKNTIISIIILSVLFLGFINSQPLLSGNMSGALKPAVLPQSYTDLRNFLSTQSDDGNMLVLPMPSWLSDFTWDNDMNHIINPIRDVSPIPLIYDEYNEANLNTLQKDLAHQLYSSQGYYAEDRLTDLLKILNVRYILVQNDQLEPIMGMAPGTNTIILAQIKNNLNHYSYVYLEKSFGDLDLYEVNDTIFLQQIYASLNPILVNGSVEEIVGTAAPGNFVYFSSNQLNPSQTQLIEGYNNTIKPSDDIEYASKSGNDGPLINFQQINPTKYTAHVNASVPFFLIFSQSFNNGWVATINGQQISNQYHFTANGYANGWYINKTGTYTLTLEFIPQNLFYVGVAVSITTVILCIMYVSKNKLKIAYQKCIKKYSNNFFGYFIKAITSLKTKLSFFLVLLQSLRLVSTQQAFPTYSCLGVIFSGHPSAKDETIDTS